MLAGLVLARCGVAQNLLPEPGLESGGTGWSLYKTGSGAGTLSFPAIAAHSGGAGAQVVVTKSVPDSNWKVQLQPPLWTSKPSSIYRFSFWAKGPGSIHVGVSDIDSGKVGSYTYIGGFSASLGSDWKQFSGLVSTYGRGGEGAVRANLYLGSLAGTYQFDDFTVEEVPAPDPAWYGRAQSRIDSFRQKTQKFRLLDPSGAVLSGAATARLVRHEFPFGTALAFQNTGNPTGDELWYRQTAAKLFNAAVFENDFKWPSFEATKGAPDTAKIRIYLKWADSLGIAFRGHALVWGIQKYGYDKFWGTDTASLSCDEIAANIKARILRDVAYYKGRLGEYDVWNEALHETAFFDKCRSNPLYAPQGWALQDSAFAWAHRADPTAMLYINDYSNVDGGGTEEYYQEIKGMLERKVPVTGIGIQCHFGGTPLNLATLQLNMDRLASLGLPIKVTEYDNEKWTGAGAFTPTSQAEEFSRFVRFMYSHPAVNGIMLWGFWDARHWISNDNAAASPGLYTADKSAKPAADSLSRLWNEVWTTRASASVAGDGALSFIGYPGTYQIELLGGDAQVWTATARAVAGATVDVQLVRKAGTSIRARKTLAGIQIRSVKGALEVATPQQKSAEIEIVDMGGNRRFRGSTSAESPVCRFLSVPEGMYLVRIQASEGDAVRQVLVTTGAQAN